jgi:chemotaxis protein MotA
MLVVAGYVVVLLTVLVGFTSAGGHIGALIQPAEFVVIGGAALGALIVMSPKKVLLDLLHGLVQSIKGTPYNKAGYEDLFKVLYELLRLARREGLLALESHVSSPHESSILNRSPRVAKNHHMMEFICGALSPVIDGSLKPEQLASLLEGELKVMEQEHHAPIDVLSKTADALPGFGIVAAVLGIVITMGAINGPIEEVGEHVAAALVGTFLGVLLSYGFAGPLAVKMEFLAAAEVAYFRAAAVVIQGLVSGLPPKVAVEQACRQVAAEVRPSRERLEELFTQAESS